MRNRGLNRAAEQKRQHRRGKVNAAAGEPAGQHLAPTENANAQRAGLAAQLRRHLIARQSAKIMENQGKPIFARKFVQLVVEDGFHLLQIRRGKAIAVVGMVPHDLLVVMALFPVLSSFFRSANVQRQSRRHLLQPRAKSLDLCAFFRLKRQGEKHGLGGVFRVVLVLGHALANRENHGRVTAHDLLERPLVTVLHEFGEQFLPARRRPVQGAVQSASAIKDAAIKLALLGKISRRIVARQRRGFLRSNQKSGQVSPRQADGHRGHNIAEIMGVFQDSFQSHGGGEYKKYPSP